MKIHVLSLFPALIFLPNHALAGDSNDAELIRSMQHQKSIDTKLQMESDVMLERASETISYLLENGETPCAQVQHIDLTSGTNGTFSFLPSEVIEKTGFKAGMCLGANNLQKLQKAAQQIVLSRGYITSQAIIQPQDMIDGILRLDVIAGKVGDIRYQEKRNEKTAEGSISGFNNKFPLYKNKILNLQDIEQGLENLRRLPSVETNIQIMPSEEEGKSDLLVNWQQDKPVRFSIGIDDSGSKTTGKYRGNFSLSVDNPFGLSDLFYVSYGRGLAHQTKLTDEAGVETKSGSRSYSLHYSVPVKKWLFSFNHSGYRYHEATEGYTVNYDYNGKQYGNDLTAERMIWRNGHHKTTAAAKLWSRQVSKYIDDTEIEVQRHRMAGWEAEFRHRAYLGRWQLEGKLSYKRGTGMRQSIPVQEEDDSTDASRMKVITAEIDASVPFKLGKQQFSYETSFFTQWNKTPLVSQDKLTIGSRYTIRGFDGDQSLSGERGFYWQNTLAWYFHPRHQFYLGVDTGHISGESTQYMTRKGLTGATIGFKGSQKIGGNLYYNLFMGKPLHKPEGFKTAKTTYGFSANYNF